MTRRWRLRALGLSLLAVAVSAGCGTTVDLASVAQTPGATGDALTAPTGSASPGAAQPGGVAPQGPTAGGGTSTGGSTGSGTVATGGTGSSASAPSPGAAPGSRRTGGQGAVTTAIAPGITADAIRIGVQTSSDADAGNRAIGAAGAAGRYDYTDVFDAVIDYANKNGGFAGRRLVPDYYDYSVAKDMNVQDQAACSHWTQDTKVFGIVGARNDGMKLCAEKAGAISLVSGTSISSTYQKYPHFFEPFGTKLDRLGSVTVNGLYKSGYFSGRLGMVTWDHPNYHYAIDHDWLPTLASHGVRPATDVQYVKVPDQLDGIASMSAAMASIVQKFKTLGIDHVIIVDGAAGVFSGAGLTFEFMNQAESQSYRPRYGQNADNAPGWDVLPAAQMNHALAILDSDYQAKYDEGIRANQSREKCFQIQRDAGLPVEGNEQDQGRAAQACDIVFFLQQVINSLDVVTNDSFAQAVARLGTSFGSAFVYGTKFGPGRRDGSDRARTAEYLQSCRCLKYRGGTYSTS
jgi:hypothetical protein